MKLVFSNLKPAHLILGLSVLLFALTKAANTSFTHDESFSYLHFTQAGFMNIISFSNWYSNNHVLNSLFMKYSYQFLGSSELALRIPNLILFVIYLIYSFRLFSKSQPLTALSLFILLCSNIFIIDSFSLARGYGLSYGFMLISLFHFMKSFEKDHRKNIMLFHLGALLAVLSHFTLLLFYASLLLIYNLIVLLENKFRNIHKFNFYKNNKDHFLPFLIVCIILYEPVRRLIFRTQLDSGGKTGFIDDTLSTLIFRSLHVKSLAATEIFFLNIVFIGIVLIPSLIIIRHFRRSDAVFLKNNREMIILNFLLITIYFLIVLQHFLFGADYPNGRFAIFLFPLYIIHFGFFMQYLASVYNKKIIIAFISTVALASMVNFISKAESQTYFDWSYEKETKNVIGKIADNYKTHPGPGQIKIGINWMFEPTINFYIKTKNLSWIKPVDRNGLNKEDDYWYVFKDEMKKLPAKDYTILKEYSEIETVLVKNKK